MKYLVIDGNFFMYRAIHKMGDLKRSDGKSTGMEYGFLRMLKSIVDNIKPDKTVVVFDGGLSPFRLETLPEYKANRTHKKTNDKSILIEMIESLGIGVFSYNGVEADDIIGILSRLLHNDEKLVIASSDTDFCQLIGPSVKVFDPIKKEYLKSPVEPSDYVIYKSIVGDVADNIVGLKRFGKVKAKKKIHDEWTKDEERIITRNEDVIKITLNMSDFSRYYPAITSYFNDQFMSWIERDYPKRFGRFIELCKMMEFYTVDSNLVSWQNTFGKKINIDNCW